MRKLIVPALAAAFLVSAAGAYAGGPGCSSKSAAAGTGKSTCNWSKTTTEGTKIETARTADGSLVVLYTSDKPDVVKVLQEKAAAGAESFTCGICREMAKADDCKVELVPFSGGVMAFVTSDKRESIDAFEKQYAALTAAETAPAAR